jgi:formate dehydrogenase major subunit
MIDLVKGVEPDTGYGTILKVSEAESAMRESRIRKTKTVCTYCGVGCSFDIWTKDRHILKVEPSEGARQRHLHLHQRKIRAGIL